VSRSTHLPFHFPNISWNILCIDPVEVARQLTLQHWKYFVRIKPRELLEQRWLKVCVCVCVCVCVLRFFIDFVLQGRSHAAPNVAAWVEAFNLLSGTLLLQHNHYHLSNINPIST
jgi:hypothetical protein